MLMTSNTDVNGGTVSGGQCHLDDVVITATPMHPIAGTENGALRLHRKGGEYTKTVYALPNLGPAVTHGFEARFRYRLVTAGVADPGNGFSFNYGPLRAGVHSGAVGFGQGLGVAFLTGAGNGGHFALVDGLPLPGGSSSVRPLADGAWHTVSIRWRETAGTGLNSRSLGSLTVSVDDVALLRDVPANFAPEAGDTFAFAAATGGPFTEELLLDDVSVQPIGPDQYWREYDGLPTNATLLGDGSVTTATVAGSAGVDYVAGRVGYRLAKDGTFFNLTSYALPALSKDATQGFEATFLYYMAAVSAPAADGFAFNLGNLESANSGPGGFADGLAVSFDVYSVNAHRVLVDGAVVPGGSHPAPPFVDGQWHAVHIRWEKTAVANGELSLTVDGVPLFASLATPGFTATAADRFAFTAFTGGYTVDVLLDDVRVRPLVTSPFPLDPVLIRRTPNPDPYVGIFPLRWGSVAGRNHRVEFSGDLATWQTLRTFPGVDGFDFLTPVVGLRTTPEGFYRIIRE
jgi:hypothetical protein